MANGEPTVHVPLKLVSSPRPFVAGRLSIRDYKRPATKGSGGRDYIEVQINLGSYK